ncbi:protein eva-1 homolog C-like isoform X4 [Sphaerodactylus townsendi]|uniref:protein eva-1 homolog C-like isoform X4 n=1 Tax=Sphaerodactylus townsendi TaxID=933632 RepID=UPI002025BC39|nr:protein eva-1 homolog C-like isoform X4 [Sphaerodactylus townsendi]
MSGCLPAGFSSALLLGVFLGWTLSGSRLARSSSDFSEKMDDGAAAEGMSKKMAKGTGAGNSNPAPQLLSEGYIASILKNYTDHACDGDYVLLRCPHRTTISIQASFYGRLVPSHQMCPSRYPQSSATLVKEDVSCSASTSLQKILEECQDKRSCQFLVNNRLFGVDPCPGTSKYLLVWYKCRPNEYKSKVACEDDKLRLSCKRSLVIAIYSAIFGRNHGGNLECPYHDLGIPAIVPKKLLHETQPNPTSYQGVPQTRFPQLPREPDPNVIGDGTFISDASSSTADHILPEKEKGRSAATFYPLDTRPLLLPVDERTVVSNTMEPAGTGAEMELLSNILAASSFITENPERAALYFVSGVCIGLLLTLLALVLRVSCRTDCKRSRPKKPPRETGSDSSESDDDSDTMSDLSARRHRRFERTLNMNVFTSAEELERAQRLEERERIIREIWMNGQPDIPGTRSLNRYY